VPLRLSQNAPPCLAQACYQAEDGVTTVAACIAVGAATDRALNDVKSAAFMRHTAPIRSLIAYRPFSPSP
jgi:hypothetical protein